jgi:hypothetical protein
MQKAIEDLQRRRPLWEALSDLFLDTELMENDLAWIAKRVLESGYNRADVSYVLWNEVFPVLEKMS